jgi:AcrR family transcriptional regulator
MKEGSRQRLAKFNRTNILDAARVLFEEKGVEPTTMDDLARQAGYSKSTLYVYFHSKDEVYHTLLAEGMLLLRDSLRDIAAQKLDFDTSFDAVCSILMALQEKNPLYFRGLLEPIAVDPDSLGKEPALQTLYDAGEEINEILTDMLKRGMAEGAVDPTLPLLSTIFALWAGACGMIRMADNKRAYFENSLHVPRDEFLRSGFALLRQGLRK